MNTDVNQMLEFFDKNFKAAVIKRLQQPMKNSPEANVEIGNLRKEIVVMKNNQMEIIELKNPTEMF